MHSLCKSSAGEKMATRKSTRVPPTSAAAKAVSRSSVGAPANKHGARANRNPQVLKMRGTQALAAAFPHNVNKPLEYERAAALHPSAGQTAKPSKPSVSGSTLSEANSSAKTGAGEPVIGANPLSGPLDRVRVDSGGHALTTNQGVEIADNQNSLKAGLRGPTLLEDFILREKITHFDHERIPERIVHARGSAAHGYFECDEALTKHTRASIFAKAGKRTPVFVRFSTVVGERGSADTARDVRGFAVKFYTDEGNWDLVGNNIPIFFIQDAMKFPDLIHAAKPEPHFAMPQAATAHDTFWDFISLMPESTAMMLWAMSDRAIPRSYRMMQGFGVHTFRLVNDKGESQFVKFHWNPIAGTHSLVWDEAVKISGADPDFHRRDLWEAIEAGAYPQWELGVQIFTEEQAEKFSFDVLDATKLIPEELVPVRRIGRMILNRNPDNFFAETEQVAFCTAHVVPGIDFSNDPLLAGRIHSYVDTQISRLGGPNFHELPINAPLAPAHNNQRDGMHRQAINRGRVSYEPNSLGGGCPFQAGARGFVSYAEPIEKREHKIRGKAERFADHYTQAKLFWNSQSALEKAHIIGAFRFELTRVQTVAVRERMVSSLANVAAELAEAVAQGLGMTQVPAPMPKATQAKVRPEVVASPPLSLFARPGDGSIATRRVAILVADEVVGKQLLALHAGLTAAGAVPRFVGVRLGPVTTSDGASIEVDATLETTPSVLFDAVVLPDGAAAVATLVRDGHAIEFIRDQYRHCKTIVAFGAAVDLLKKAGARPSGSDGGVLRISERSEAQILKAVIAAIAQHRHYARDMDPPAI
jgi:catalase